MSDPARTAIAVTLLATDEPARRLVLAWALVPPGLRGARLLVAWSRLAAVPRLQTERLAHGLFAHQIVHEDRTVDPEALRVVQHVAAETLRSTQRGRR